MADFKAFSPSSWKAFTKKCAALFPFLKKQYNMTSAEWEALTAAERIALAGQNVVITDDEGTQTFDDIIPSDASSTNKLTTQSALTTVDSKIGDLADLDTTVKTDVVSALNEINEKASDDWDYSYDAEFSGTVSGTLRYRQKGNVCYAGIALDDLTVTAGIYTVTIPNITGVPDYSSRVKGFLIGNDGVTYGSFIVSNATTLRISFTQSSSGGGDDVGFDLRWTTSVIID